MIRCGGGFGRAATPGVGSANRKLVVGAIPAWRDRVVSGPCGVPSRTVSREGHPEKGMPGIRKRGARPFRGWPPLQRAVATARTRQHAPQTMAQERARLRPAMVHPAPRWRSGRLPAGLEGPGRGAGRKRL